MCVRVLNRFSGTQPFVKGAGQVLRSLGMCARVLGRFLGH